MEFSMLRVIRAMFRDITLLKNTIITALAVASGVLFIGLFFMKRGDDNLSADEFLGIFGLCFMVLGILFTFALLKETHNPKLNNLYLALPISPLERLTAVWLSATFAHALGFTLVAMVVGQLAIFFGAAAFGSNFHAVSLFSDGYWQLIKGYLIIQPLFLCGAMAFSKNRIAKTLLVLLVLFLSLMFFGIALFSILNHKYGVYPGDLIADEAFSLARNDFSGVSSWFFAILLGPVMLLAAYFKLVEKQV